jgi:Ca-activated chloride channel family protein
LTELGTKRDEVLSRIDNLFADGGTRMIDTILEAHTTLAQEPPGERIRAIVVLSDGADNESINSPTELLQLLQADESGQSIKVFTISYGEGSDAELLRQISEASGAQTYQSEPGEIEQVYRDIATFF